MKRIERWRRLRHHRLQSILAVAAIGAAVALPVVLISVGGGVFAHELASIESSGYAIVVSASGLHGVNAAHELAGQILAIPSVAAASPVLSVPIDVYLNGGGPTPVLAEGILPGQFAQTVGPSERSLFPLPLPLGDPTDIVHFANGTYAGTPTLDVLVSSPLAQSLNLSSGTSLLLSPTTNRTLGQTYSVTGVFGVPPSVLGPTAAYALLLPLSDLQLMTGNARVGNGPVLDAADTIQVALAGSAATDPGTIAAVAQRISTLVPFYGVSTLTQQAEQLRGASAVLTGFYLALSSVALAVGLIFLAVVLLRRVESLRLSIGIRRAIGVPNRQIAFEMMTNGLVLAGGGSVSGVAGGVLLVEVMRVYGSPIVASTAALAIFDPKILVPLVLAVLVLSLLASAAATRAALRLSVPEALR